jgi:hypothetical protein
MAGPGTKAKPAHTSLWDEFCGAEVSSCHILGSEFLLDLDYFPLVSLGYAALTGAICMYERNRIRASGPDVVTVFMFLFVLQCCLPGIVIFACLPFVDPLSPLDNLAFDRILSRVDALTACLVLGLTASFAVFFYGILHFSGNLLRAAGRTLPSGQRFVVFGAEGRLLTVLAFGVAFTLISFFFIGDSMIERYTNLILLRQYSEDVESNVLTAYGFALTQSWAWLSVPALFVVSDTRGRGILWYICVASLVTLAVLGVSRRAIFIPFLLAYLTLVLFDGRWRVKWLLAASIPVLIWVGFGKEILSTVASGRGLEEVGERYSTLAGAVIRTASDVGVTLVESLGSITLLDVDLRFGVDHLLSFLRKIPVSWVGWEPDMPPRIVRLSTEAFARFDDQDIPPGLFGQMWLDFGVLGPMVWAALFAVPMSILKRISGTTVITRQAAAVFALLTFVIALPLNSGSYDFTFSVDIFVLLLAMFFSFRMRRVRVAGIHAELGVAPEAASGIPSASRK